MGCGASKDASDTEAPKLNQKSVSIKEDGSTGESKPKFDARRTQSSKLASLSLLSQEHALPTLQNTVFRRLAIPLEQVEDFSEESEGFEIDDLEEKPADDNLDDEEVKIVIGALKNHYLFSDLPDSALRKIFGVMDKIEVDAGETVIEQGDVDANFFYVVKSGKLAVKIGKDAAIKRKKFSVQIGETHSKRYESGDCFGELALLYNTVRNASIITETSSTLWRLERTVFRKLLLKYSSESKKMNFLRQVPLFRDLSDHSLTNWGKSLKIQSFKANELIFGKDSPAKFCVVYKGEVLYKKKDYQGKESTTRLHPTSFFGDREILFDSGFELDYYASEDGATIVSMDSEEFMNMRQYLDSALDDNIKFTALRNIPLLEQLTEEQIIEVVDAFIQENYAKGDVIIRKGDLGDKVYIVKRGQLEIEVGAETFYCKPYDYCGERALLYEETRAATVLAGSDIVSVLCLTRENFEQLLGPLTNMTKQKNALNVLKEVDFLKETDEKELMALADAMTVSRYEEGHAIVNQGEIGDKFYVMKEGRAVVTRNDDRSKILAQYERGGFFGERALLDDEPRAANIKAYGGPVICFEITRDDFHQHFRALTNVIRLQARTLRQFEEEKEMTFLKLREIAVVGHGTYGRVKMMQCKATGRVYALKSLIKQNIRNAGIQYQVLNEVRCMATLDHPFITRLVKTYTDAKRVHILMDFAIGGEVFSYLGTPFPVAYVRFYAACVVCMLAHMHKRSIIYRDLKSENLMLNNDGYLVLVDFSFAKTLMKGERTYTICGTPDFLAPEIIKQSGHDRGVDYWALGVLIYEFLTCTTPFKGETHHETYTNIVKGKINFPRNMNKNAKDLIKKLCCLNSKDRLGMGTQGIKEITTHPFFQGIDWLKLESKKYHAPLIPEVKSSVDTSCFCIQPEEADEPDDIEDPVLDSFFGQEF